MSRTYPEGGRISGYINLDTSIRDRKFFMFLLNSKQEGTYLVEVFVNVLDVRLCFSHD